MNQAKHRKNGRSSSRCWWWHRFFQINPL